MVFIRLNQRLSTLTASRVRAYVLEGFTCELTNPP
jgi:hypothetical protein